MTGSTNPRNSGISVVEIPARGQVIPATRESVTAFIGPSGMLSLRAPSTSISPSSVKNGGNTPGSEPEARTACQTGPARWMRASCPERLLETAKYGFQRSSIR